MKQRATWVGIAGFLILASIGCQAAKPRPFFPTGERPAETSVINEGGELIIRNINGKAVPGRNRFMSQLASDSSRYEVPAGPCSLGVQHADGRPKTVTFQAKPGEEYQLDSYLKIRILQLPIQPDQWDVMIKEKKTGKLITETRDARK